VTSKIVKTVQSNIVESTLRKMLYNIIMETTDQIYHMEDDAMATCKNFLDRFITEEVSSIIETETLTVAKQIALKSIDFDDNRVEVLVGPKRESSVSSLGNMSDEVPSDDNDAPIKFTDKGKVDQQLLLNTVKTIF